MNRLPKTQILFITLLSGLLISCQKGQEIPSSTSESPYPVSIPNQAYPAPPTVIPGATSIQFDRPIKATATQITGSAPAGVIVNIVNVTMMGEVIGSGVANSDNRFIIQVTPLIVNIRIGIEVADVGSSGLAYNDFYNDAYQGAGAMSIPNVGIFQDTVLVEP